MSCTKKIIITNNPLVNEHYKGKDTQFYPDYALLEVLKEARNKIHQGHELLTHPLSGSIKPNETPYKTIAVSKDIAELNLASLSLIEESIMTTEKFLDNAKIKNWTEKVLKDFQLIDYDLIINAI